MEIDVGMRVIRILRLHYSDDMPVSLSEDVLPYSRCSFVLGHRLQTDSLHRVLSYRYDTRIYRSVRRMSARIATDSEADKLGIEPGSVVNLTLRKSYNRMNAIVESTVAVYRGDFELSFETVEAP